MLKQEANRQRPERHLGRGVKIVDGDYEQRLQHKI